MKKRILAIFLTMALMLTVLPFSVSANSPEPSPWYEFRLSNLPEGTMYVDLLIYLPESDPMYTDLNANNIPDGFTQKAQILSFCEDGYRSYTFHYKDAISVICVDRLSEVHFFTDEAYELTRYDHADEIYQKGEIRLAMLDPQGNILKVSPILELNPKQFLVYTLGTFEYDAKTEDFEVKTSRSGVGVILYVFLCLAGIVLTCFVEKLVAIPFKLNKQFAGLITRTNVFSQLLMHVGYVMFYSLVFWKYTYATVVLEVLVYFGEYCWYRRTMKEVSQSRCLAYTVAANTVSLMMGLLIF